jgi:two-component system, chemotaxis family, chemotaxis protein CheY
MLALVVDDSLTARLKLSRALVAKGYEVLEAENGKEALQRLERSSTPDVALVNWNMPLMNGLAFVKEVRADSRFDEMRVVMVTSETAGTKVARALMAGADEYLMKPYSSAMLFEKLELLGLGRCS